jgi:hypothetical protein
MATVTTRAGRRSSSERIQGAAARASVRARRITDVAPTTSSLRRYRSPILRDKGTPAAELGLVDPGTTDEAILDAMVEHPILVNRPIVVTPKGVKLSRPSEVVLDLLERKPESFTKEDGEVVRPGA